MATREKPHNLLTILYIFALLTAAAGCTRKPPASVLSAVAPEQKQMEIRKHYLLRCSSCHGEFGEGKIGPNLADDFWIHGEGTKGDLVKMIADGVVEKGMPGWKNVYHADDISALADLVQAFQGTHPKNAKAPQGKQIVSKIEVITPDMPALKLNKEK